MASSLACFCLHVFLKNVHSYLSAKIICASKHVKNLEIDNETQIILSLQSKQNLIKHFVKLVSRTRQVPAKLNSFPLRDNWIEKQYYACPVQNCKFVTLYPTEFIIHKGKESIALHLCTRTKILNIKAFMHLQLKNGT